jgi:phosphate-selective porin OprO and OprP
MDSRALALSFVAVLVAGSVVEAQPEPAATAAPKPPAFTAGYKDGFVLQSETGDFKLKITGYAQADGRFAVADEGDLVTNAFLVRRVRPSVQGTVARYFDFSIVPDFGGGATAVQDAYIDVHFTDKLRIRAGKGKVPLGLERLQSGQVLWFVERALTNNLTPNRDIGLQVHGELAKGVVTYALGVLNGTADGGSVETDTNDSKDVVGRLFLQPFKTKSTSLLRGLGLGIAGTHGKASSTSLAAYRSVSQVTVFSYLQGVTATGNRDRISPQAYFFNGPVGVLAEYVQSRQTASRIDESQVTITRDLTQKAWSVSATVVVTGETASYGAVKPKSFFVPSAGSWGALQLVARVNRLDVDDDSFSGGFADPAKSISRATAVGGGVTWIWNNNLRWLLSGEQTKFKGGAAQGDRATEKSAQTRLQLSF